MKKISAAIGGLSLLIFTTAAGAQQLQPANEVQVQAQAQPTGEADMIDPFQGCKPKVKPSCQARIVCTGISTIHANNPRAVHIKQLDKTYSKESGAGTQAHQELGILSSQVNSTSAEQFLQGVAVIGGKVDMQAGLVSVVIGQSCDTVATAQGISQKMQQGQAQQQSGGGAPTGQSGEAMGGPQVHYGKPGSVIQRPTNDF